MEKGERWTDRAAVAVISAHRHAEDGRRDEADANDLLIGLLAAGHGVAVQVLDALGIDRAALQQTAGGGTWRPGYSKQAIPPTADGFDLLEAGHLSTEVHQMLAWAAEEATDQQAGTEHLLIALLRHGSAVLIDAGLRLNDVRRELSRQLAAFHRGRPTLLPPEAADALIGIPRVSLPAEVAQLDVQILEARARKEVAVDNQDYEAAGVIRDGERALMAERAAQVRAWAATVDLPSLIEEVEALRDAVDRLRA